eukprot:CAMPEP_0184867152 /NCGR_PEP_ID=MMETSP0580-20130426/25198_1 /TAXON_ID=1118495 /ORGANISM="Dactyliosolen fragilissimus" /LENGTH=488 /DNA_ID=CAMNT_0027367229 /DNA_START=194 /DNA_END=1658 /DNA_ORIENTATION=+
MNSYCDWKNNHSLYTGTTRTFQSFLPNLPSRTFNIRSSSLFTTTAKSSSNSANAASTNLTKIKDDVTEAMRLESIHVFEKYKDWYNTSEHHDNTPEPLFLDALSKDAARYIDKHFDAILFDCDGVLYRGGGHLAPNVADTLTSLIQKGKYVRFVTNNSASSRKALCEKLTSLFGMESSQKQKEDYGVVGGKQKVVLTEDMMVTSGYAAGRYLKRYFYERSDNLTNDGRKDDDREFKKPIVHVVGEKGLRDELNSLAPFHIVTDHDNDNDEDENSITSKTNSSPSSMTRDELSSYTFRHPNIDALVIGLDTNFTYRKLCIAVNLLKRNPSALFIVTNADAFDTVGAMGSESTRYLPGNGSLVACVEAAAGRKGILVGKPSDFLAGLIQDDLIGLKNNNLDNSNGSGDEAQHDNFVDGDTIHIPMERVLMVGDRLDTDVKFGIQSGMRSALVFTGCTTLEHLIDLGVDGSEEEPLPHIFIPHIGVLSEKP